MECYIQGTKIYYEEYGTGKPLLCIHGFPEDHTVMTSCLEPLFHNIKGIRRIYIDLPGMGKSPATVQIQNADDMLHILKGFIREIIGDKSFLLAGQSYGGYMSLGLLFQLKEKIDGVFLLCPCTVAEKEKRVLPAKQIRIKDHHLVSTHSVDKDFQKYMEFAVVVTEKTWDRYKSEILPGLQAADTVFTEQYQSTGYSFSFRDEMEKMRFDKPTCALTGRQDNCVGYADTYQLMNNFSRSTFVIVDKAGHNLQIENPDLFKTHFEDWILQFESVKVFL